MEKPIVFKNKRGKQLVGILHLPKGKKKFPLVVLCHGFDGWKSKRIFTGLARFLEKKGVAVFRFDFEGHGDSEGEMEGITVKREVADLNSAMNFILRYPGINKNQVAFVGHSLGSVVIISFLRQTGFLPEAIVFWAPALNQKKLLTIWNTKSGLKKWERDGWIIGDNKISSCYLKENKDKDYSSLLLQVKAPILIIQGGKDKTVPPRFSKEIVKKHRNIKLIIYPKAEHEFEGYYIQQKLVKDTAQWLKKHLSVYLL